MVVVYPRRYTQQVLESANIKDEVMARKKEDVRRCQDEAPGTSENPCDYEGNDPRRRVGLLRSHQREMAEGVGLEPTSPKAPVFKTGGLPVILTLRGRRG